MSTTRPVPRVVLTESQIKDLDGLFHAAARARGLALVEPIADLVRHFRRYKLDEAGIPVTRDVVAQLVTVLDAGCRAGGLGAAEIAIGLLHVIKVADEVAIELEAEGLRLVHETRMDAPRVDGEPEALAADDTHVEGVPPEAS